MRLSSQSPTAPWNLPQLQGAKLWLAADRITGLADGVAIVTCADLSGYGNNGTQATADNRFLYKTGIIAGKAVMRADGSNDRYDVTTSLLADLNNFTITTVQTGTAGASFAYHNNADGSCRINLVRSADTTFAPVVGGGADPYSPTITIGSGMRILTVKDAAKTVTVYDNGASVGSGSHANSNATPNICSIGGHAAVGLFNGDLAELIVFARALTAGELNRLHLYLGRKYGIGVS